ncbi:MAG: flagellar motor switch protein FliN [Vampirovibrionales bacterium]|nr:flagellar motor switch protein FliN [Vampirovibrionales bacterium]
MANDIENQVANTENSLGAEALETLKELLLAGLGGAAAALGGLLNVEVKISSPELSEVAISQVTPPYGDVATGLLLVQHTQGFTHTGAFAVAETDAKKIAALMMSGNLGGLNAEPIDDLEQGAAIEALSQINNAINEGIGGLLQQSIDANLPDYLPFSSEALAGALKAPQVLSITFKATLSDAAATVIPFTQYLGTDAAGDIINRLLNQDAASTANPTPQPEVNMSASDTSTNASVSTSKAVDPVTVRPVDFSSFDQQHQVYGEENKNLDLVMDVTLSLTVELGRTQLSIKDVLELTRGSVIELDRVAGEPVDLLANGKLIAKGEVVVIEDNFGLRITSIVSPAERLRGM